MFYSNYFKVPETKILLEIRKEGENITILNIPFGNMQGMYLQTLHLKKILDGHVARIPKYSLDKIEKLKYYIENHNKDTINDFLKRYNVKYVIINSIDPMFMIDKKKYDLFLSLINISKVDKEEHIIIYKITY